VSQLELVLDEIIIERPALFSIFVLTGATPANLRRKLSKNGITSRT
jgi:hypothetical protein